MNKRYGGQLNGNAKKIAGERIPRFVQSIAQTPPNRLFVKGSKCL